MGISLTVEGIPYLNLSRCQGPHPAGRLLNDHGKPYLFPHDLFTVVDAREPKDWLSEVGEDNERYAYPPPLNDCGFFENYFDGKPEVVAIF